MNPFSAIILAAGIGKRMKSRIPKVLHPICGKPMLFYVVQTAISLKPAKLVVVVSPEMDEIKGLFSKGHTPKFIVQDLPLGTGDAVIKTQSVFQNFDGSILVLCGDVPLITVATLTKLVKFHHKMGAAATVLTAVVQEPSLYGRIICNGDKIIRIVEDADAVQSEKEINEINTGIYVFEKTPLFDALHKIQPLNTQNEYYLTDTLELLHKKGLPVYPFRAPDCQETIGINTRKTLTEVEQILQFRIIEHLQLEGVTIENPETVRIDADVKIGSDTVIHPGARILGQTQIGDGCEIGANTLIANSKLSSRTKIGDGSSIENATL